jgi:thermitase
LKCQFWTNKAATREFKNYSPSSFKELNLESVGDLTGKTADNVKKKIAGEQIQEKNLKINLDKYRTILSLKLQEKGKDKVLEAIKKLEQRAEVVSASPNYIVSATASPNDAFVSSQWALNKIQLPAAWDISAGQNNVKVGVLDTGIWAGHPDLTNRIYRENPHTISNTIHRDFVASLGGVPVLDPVDVKGHGTHVAGIIGAETNNS